MTDLQLSLIGLAGVFVAGVFTYNKVQEYKAKKSVERAFGTDHDDVLMRDPNLPPGPSYAQQPTPAVPAASPAMRATAPAPSNAPAVAPSAVPSPASGRDPAMRQEPSFSLDEPAPESSAAPAAPSADTFSAVTTPVSPALPPIPEFTIDPVAPGAPEPDVDELAARANAAAAAAAEQATALVDPLIDCLLPLALETPLRGDKLLPVLQTLRMVGNKPLHYIGLAVSGDWEPIAYGGVYTKLQGGIQLASRSTALNELEYSELVTRLRAMSDEIGAEPEVPDMIEVMAEARNLHRFVASHDAQLGVNLQSNGAPWAINTLIGALEKQGFDLRPDGRYVMPDGDGGFLFSLSTNVTLAEETTSRLTLLLDVPCVAPARDGFGAMVACARSLMSRLDATIVDDYNQPLSDAALAEIAKQVQDFYAEMNDADIPAGSTRALRLFS
ncbi:cell division protein [Duganella sp. Leaf126]|uniref:cell division protein ZipA C-terminal FtsZ-binding domain-containing protein n=1 Tax=Duganella sp. Leaf126 TaxID=1736266 RepID=UPI000701950D|nr:cell division protein ZipA C-terminal FtsZ-binding domain-containing protein [Duganella sp. Leaf126]KQQ36063.1 cell division protein [Duganella sp. Leaf126]